MPKSRIDLRVSEEEKQAFQRAAELSGLSLSSWIRERLRELARTELKRSGESIPFLSSKQPNQ